MIICCGEALIDMLPRKAQTGEDVFLPVAGGALFNTAISLGRLGEETGFVSGISNDMFGEQLIDVLTKSNVSSQYCIRSDFNTTLAFVKLTDGHAEYSFFDEKSAGRQVEIHDLPDLPDHINAIHFGAISLIPEPCGSAYEQLLKLEAPRSVISIDPNIRANFINDCDAHRARILRMCAEADIIKVSDEDLDWIANGQDAKTMIAKWRADHTSIVIVTKGEDGADIYYHGGLLEVPVQPTTVVDTVGAGDTYNAGFLSALNKAGVLNKNALKTIDKDVLAQAGAFAAKVASVTVSRAGANPPWAHEL